MSMQYAVDVRKNKSEAKCRVCGKRIHTGSICVFVEGSDGFNNFRLVAHTDCFLSFIIKKVKQFQIDALNEEVKKFDSVEKILRDEKISKVRRD